MRVTIQPVEVDRLGSVRLTVREDRESVQRPRDRQARPDLVGKVDRRKVVMVRELYI